MFIKSNSFEFKIRFMIAFDSKKFFNDYSLKHNIFYFIY